MGKRKYRPLLSWVYDNREQQPFDLAAPDDADWTDGGYYFTTLSEGDITAEVDGERVSVVIERKQHGDFVNCCAKKRETFERELARLCAYSSAYVLIEVPFSLLYAGHPNSPRMPGLAVVNSIACWEIRFPTIHFHAMTSRIEARKYAHTILSEAAKHHIFR